MSIAELLAAHGMTQSGLSRATGIPLRTVQDWAAGRREPSPWVVNLITFFLEHQAE